MNATGVWRRFVGWIASITRTPAETPLVNAIVINDRALTAQQVKAFNRLTAPRRLEPGHYWFDPQSGDFGWVGSPTQYLNLYLGDAPITEDPWTPDPQRLVICRKAGLIDSKGAARLARTQVAAVADAHLLHEESGREYRH